MIYILYNIVFFGLYLTISFNLLLLYIYVIHLVIVLKHTDINSYLQFKKYISIATWNVRTMNNGNTQIIIREMGRNGIDLMGISETK